MIVVFQVHCFVVKPVIIISHHVVELYRGPWEISQNPSFSFGFTLVQVIYFYNNSLDLVKQLINVQHTDDDRRELTFCSFQNRGNGQTSDDSNTYRDEDRDSLVTCHMDLCHLLGHTL